MNTSNPQDFLTQNWKKIVQLHFVDIHAYFTSFLVHLYGRRICLEKKKDPKLAISVFRLLGRSLNRMPYVCLLNRNSLIFTNTECPQFPVTSMGSEEHH